MMEQMGNYLTKRGLPGDTEIAKQLKDHAAETGDVSLEDLYEKSKSQALVPVTPPRRGSLIIKTPEGYIGPGEFQFIEHTPEMIHNLWSNFWEMAGNRVNRRLRVTKPKFNLFELATAERKGLSYIYMPPRYAKAEAIGELTFIFPWAQGDFTASGAFINQTDQSGWLTVEWTNIPPITAINQKSAQYFTGVMKQIGREPQTYNTYIVATAMHKLLTNRFWDEGYYTILSGSTDDKGEPLIVTCLASSILHAETYNESRSAGQRSVRVGFRSQGTTAYYPEIIEMPTGSLQDSIRNEAKDIKEGFNRIFGR